MKVREQSMWQAAWSTAYDVYSHLAWGGEMGQVQVNLPGLIPEAGESAVGVFDRREGVVLQYARFAEAQVSYFVPGVVATGSPSFVAAALLGNAVGRMRARTRAERASAPQWRPDLLASVVVTTRRLWCELATNTGSRWLNFDYDSITSVELMNWDLTMRFLQSAPLRLSGMWAPWCAAVVAHYRYGPGSFVPALGRPRPSAGS